MDRQKLRARLKDVTFSAKLSDDVLESIATIAQPANYPAGATIFREGSVDHNLYLIASGLVALEMHVPGRHRVRLLSLGPGDMLAWSSLLGEGRMTASAMAVEPTEIIAIPARSLLDLCAGNPQTGYEIMQQMSFALAKRLLATRLQLLDLFSTDAAMCQV